MKYVINFAVFGLCNHLLCASASKYNLKYMDQSSGTI